MKYNVFSIYLKDQAITQITSGVTAELGRQGLGVETPQGMLAREQSK